MNDRRSLPLRRWQGKKHSNTTILDQDEEDSPESSATTAAQATPRRGTKSFLNAEKEATNLTHTTEASLKNTSTPRRRDKRLLQPTSEEAPPPPDKHRRKPALDDAPRAITGNYELVDISIAIQDHPPRRRAPLPSPSPRGMSEERGSADRRGEDGSAFKIAQGHCSLGKERKARTRMLVHVRDSHSDART
jgi:hypothetical protein